MKKTSKFIFVLLSAILFISSCKKEESTDETTSNGNNNSTTVTVTIAGRVLSVNNYPVANAIVTAYGNTTTTNSFGIFFFDGIKVNKDRCILKVSTSGASLAWAFIPSANTVNYTRVVLTTPAAYTVNGASGGLITLPNNASVLFSSNSFITASGAPFNGQVNLKVIQLSPDDPNFSFSIPGGDLAAKDLSGKDVVLKSYGMVNVELTDAATSQPLKLAQGKPATIKIPISSSQLNSAPASLPLWYFNETTALWMEEGTAVKSGGFYIGTVNHFSWWNFDIPGQIATITGRVIDCEGNPIPNVAVIVSGYVLITNQNGIYTSLVPMNWPLTAQFISTLYGNSQIENIPALSAGQIFNVPDLLVVCPSSIKGTLTNCSGGPSQGIVYVAMSQAFSSFVVANNGAFNIFVPEASAVTLFAFNGNKFGTQSLTTPVAPGVLNINNITLCDTNNATYENSFILDGPGFINQKFNIEPTNTGGNKNFTTGELALWVYGNNPVTGDIINVECIISGDVPGNYTTTLHVFIGGVQTHDFYFPQASVELIEFGPVGGRIKVEFSGYYQDLTTLDTYHVYDGKMNVTRQF